MTAVPPQPGDRLSEQYTLGEPISQGGMALIFRARDLRHGRDVAVKFLRPDLMERIGTDRFRREISIAATLSHPHIVPLYDSGVFRGRLFFVMPLVAGETLQAALARDGPLPLERVISITQDVGKALTYAHERGVVHRDVKPANIILTHDAAVVADFGVAKALGDAATLDLTLADSAVGTPRYMAPEQATRPGEVTRSADIYSLGCVVYEMLAGTPAFPQSHLPALIAGHLLLDPAPLTSLAPSVPDQAAQAVHRAMAKDPGERFEEVAHFVDALEGGAERPARRAGNPPRRRRRWMSGALTAAVAVATLGLWAARGLRSREGDLWEAGVPASVLVLPVAGPASTESERTLAVRLAQDLTSELGQWNLRAVPSVVLAGPMFDRGIDGPTVATLEDAVALGRDLDVSAVAVISAALRADTARVEAALLDVARRGLFGAPRMVGDPVTTAGLAGSGVALIEPIARRILGLESASFESALARWRDSRVPAALQQADDGQRLLESWRLSEAEERFRNAVALDSTYALAHLRLGQTLYWRGAEDPALFARLSQAAYRAATSALRHARGLPQADSAHIAAFQHFAGGGYEEARRAYRALLERDPTDVYALLMLGSVEYRDPWLAEGDPAGPRSSWNAAARAFHAAVRLQPAFQLGYGSLFDIYARARQAYTTSYCRGFERPRPGVELPPWEPMTPQHMVPYCLSVGDSLAWVEFRPGAPTEVAPAGVEPAVLQLAESALSRWAAVDSTSPQPLRELARLRLLDRAAAAPGDPARHRAAAEEALRLRTRALALDTDTSALELLQIANLHLAAGRPDTAAALALAVLDEVGPDGRFAHEPLPGLAVNPLLATGRATRALAIIGSLPPRGHAIEPGTGRTVPFGPAEAALGRLQVLGSLMLTGGLEAQVRAARAAWASAGTSADDERLLRLSALTDVFSALMQDDWLLNEWTGDIDDLGSTLRNAAREMARDPTGTPTRARRTLEALLDPDSREAAGNAGAWFAGALLAYRAGLYDDALVLLDRFRRMPLAVDRYDPEWGYRASAPLLRARILRAQGDREGARAAARRLLDAWTPDDTLTAPVRVEAQALPVLSAGR